MLIRHMVCLPRDELINQLISLRHLSPRVPAPVLHDDPHHLQQWPRPSPHHLQKSTNINYSTFSSKVFLQFRDTYSTARIYGFTQKYGAVKKGTPVSWNWCVFEISVKRQVLEPRLVEWTPSREEYRYEKFPCFTTFWISFNILSPTFYFDADLGPDSPFLSTNKRNLLKISHRKL